MKPSRGDLQREGKQVHDREFSTDGVPEATDAAEEMFGEERLMNTLNQHPDAGPEAVIRNVHEAVKRFAGDAPQVDDITLLCFQYNGKKRKDGADPGKEI